MRSNRLRPFHVEHLASLPAACSVCPLGASGGPAGDHAKDVATWATAAQDEWGQVGVGAWDGDSLVGYLLLSTPLHVPRAGPQGGVALSPDAAVVMAIRVLDEFSRRGLGRQLVQGAAAVVAKQGGPFRALEAEATRTQPSCVLQSVRFFEETGFVVCRDGGVRVRMRLDLDRTARWRPQLGRTVDRLAAWARPLPPEPAGRALRRRAD